MHRLCRATKISSRAFGRALSTCGPASSADAAAQTRMSIDRSMGAKSFTMMGAPRTVRRGVDRPTLADYYNVAAPNRAFSSLSPAATSDGGGEEPGTRAPSVLERAGIADMTPGLALWTLQHYVGEGRHCEVRHSDFAMLCESSRPGKQKDAKVIAKVLREFKRYNHFILPISGAATAIDGMLRSMNPTWKVQDGRPRVRAALFVMQQILDDKTGLYFATETDVVDKVLGEMHGGLMEMQENGFDLRVDVSGGEGTDGGEGEEEEPKSADETLLVDSLRATQGIVQKLVYRRSRPELDMMKRARRRYKKALRVTRGPTRTTLEVGVRIAVAIGGSAAAREGIAAPFEEAWWTKGPIDGVSRQVIEEAAAEEARAAEAAAAEEARAAEAVAAEEARAEEASAAEEAETVTEGGDTEEGAGTQAEPLDAQEGGSNEAGEEGGAQAEEEPEKKA